jgi:cytoskeletal protein RodZ
MTIGTELRQAREQRGVSLRELSDRTQIRQPVLRAIESDDFKHLPGGVIMRGFLKLYAREVGLDPDEIAKRYAAQVESTERDRPGNGIAAANEDLSGISATLGAGSRFARLGAAGAVAVLALLAVAYLALRPTPAPDSGTDARDQPPAESVGASSTPKPGESPTGTAMPPEQGATAAPPAAAAAKEASAGVLRVDLHATGACWVSATADGEQVASRLMGPGERLAIRVTDQAVLRIGFPGNMTVTINDQPVRPFARPGTPITLRITPGNYRELLGQ